MAVALTMAAARRVVEADSFMRAGKYEGWLPTLFVGALLQNKTVGIIGAGRCVMIPKPPSISCIRSLDWQKVA